MWKYIERNYKETIALIPGWATDYKIFDSLDLKFNYLLPIEFSPSGFNDCLLGALKGNRIKKLSLFGWSLGGFLAAEFAYKYPDLVERLILVSIRENYKEEKLKEIEGHLKKNKNGFLYKFYNQCFYKKDRLSWFKKNLLKYYCQKMDLKYLLDMLDYLKNARIIPDALQVIKNIKIMHGEYDSVAPVQEAIDIKNNLSNAEFICIKNAAHIPFLEDDFSRVLSLRPRAKRGGSNPKVEIASSPEIKTKGSSQ